MTKRRDTGIILNVDGIGMSFEGASRFVALDGQIGDEREFLLLRKQSCK